MTPVVLAVSSEALEIINSGALIPSIRARYGSIHDGVTTKWAFLCALHAFVATGGDGGADADAQMNTALQVRARPPAWRRFPICIAALHTLTVRIRATALPDQLACVVIASSSGWLTNGANEVCSVAPVLLPSVSRPGCVFCWSA